ncbi:MAG: NepR family anti-sigma factor [Alphaproteobacteria bacterium]
MTDPKPEPAPPADDVPASGEDKTRVREALGEGLRKFYDSVLDEPIPAEWISLVGGAPDPEDR